MSKPVKLLRADPHQWGRGLVHLINHEKDQTWCGKSPGGCPGIAYWGIENEVTCKLCRRSIESQKRSVALRERWANEARQREQEKELERRAWARSYASYLQSEGWHNKRKLVMKRAGGVCEGCGQRKATEVHHIRYPRHCVPGSKEWAAQEKLFDLRAICGDCHNDVHLRRLG